jgi:hypothetical protein
MSVIHAPLLALAALAFASVANAEAVATMAPVGVSQGVSSSTVLTQAIDESELANLNGGAEDTQIAITDQTLTAINGGNTVNAGGDINNGPVSLSANAFSGFAGIGNFVINTGNNNNLQGTLSVTIVMAPGL